MAETPLAIELDRVSKTFPSAGARRARKGAPQALSEVSLQVPKGQILGLVGQSGSGKSTLAKLIVGLIKASSGRVLVGGEPVRSGRSHGHARAQMVFQDVYASLNPVHTVEHHLARAALASRVATGRPAARKAAIRLLETVALTPGEEYLPRRPGDLSGGQRQRVGIARALASAPEVVIMDEPTSMLDVSIRREVLDLIFRLRDETGITIVFITHDLVSAGYLCDRIAVLHQGELVEEEDSREILLSPRNEYTKTLIGALPRLERTAQPGGHEPRKAEAIER